MGELSASGRLSNTVVFIVGDHGESFGEHGRMQHSVVPFEEAVRVPLLIFDGRGLVSTGRDEGLRQHIDIFPTVAEIIGASVVEPGRSLLSSGGHREIFISCLWWKSCLSMIEGEEKWIYFPEIEKILKFSIVDDPQELNELEVDDDVALSVINRLFEHQGMIRSLYFLKSCGSGEDC